MIIRSVRTRLIVAIIGLSVLSSLTLIIVAHLSARHYLREQLRHRLMSIAASGAVYLQTADFSRLVNQGDENTATYQSIRQSLRKLREANPGIRYIYTIRPHRNPKQWSFLVDAEEDPKLVSHLGDLYDTSNIPEMREGLREPTADRNFTTDKWGNWLSGYAPIRDRLGRTVAVLGVNMSAEEVMYQEQQVFYTIIATAIILFFIITYCFSRWTASFTHPIVALAEATERVAEGDLSTEVTATGSDEFASLGQSFNVMLRALRANHDRMIEMGNTDFLTTLQNHRYFQERLQQEISRAARYHHSLSLIFLDLDHFRQINAIHGHQGGDDCLRQVAQLIKSALRTCDVATRYGGEEFAVILPETSAVDACQVADRLRDVVASHIFEVRSFRQRKEMRLTISGGVAEYPGDSREKDGLILAADVALLRAKHMLRNKVCRFAEDDSWPTGGMDPVELHWALQDASLAAVESLAQALDARDRYTRGHSENVTRFALAIAQAMGIQKDEQAKIRVAGLLHDIGKIGIPDRVLLKQGSLSREEWELVRAHPSVGATILAKAPMLGDIIPIVLAHHERYDGTGYPQGQRGNDIPLAARILAVADAFDAMISDRPYRIAMSVDTARKELRQCAGTQFDPFVVSAMESIKGDLTELPALLTPKIQE